MVEALCLVFEFMTSLVFNGCLFTSSDSGLCVHSVFMFVCVGQFFFFFLVKFFVVGTLCSFG